MQAKGFTLIELIVVIGILGLLLAITLIAINPQRQFAAANNSKRRSDVGEILNAINQYQTSNRGQLPTGITTTALTIAKTGGVDICASLVPNFIAALPVDPLTNNGTPVSDCTSNYSTNYTVLRSATNSRLTVSAPAAQSGETISVSR